MLGHAKVSWREVLRTKRWRSLSDSTKASAQYIQLQHHNGSRIGTSYQLSDLLFPQLPAKLCPHASLSFDLCTYQESSNGGHIHNVGKDSWEEGNAGRTYPLFIVEIKSEVDHRLIVVYGRSIVNCWFTQHPSSRFRGQENTQDLEFQ